MNDASLSPEAQEALDKGVLAAKQQDYLLAIRYFQDARKLAPDAPEIYFDLGLAESKIPGRELRAIAWFGAYLAANPNASNAGAAEDQIDMLDVKSQSNLSRLIQTAQETLSKTSADKKVGGLTVVSQLWADTGDIQAALKSAELIYVQSDADRPNSFDWKTEMHRPTPSDKNRVFAYIAKVQAEGGDIAGAQDTANLIRDAEDKSEAQMFIAKAQAEVGDVADAQKAVGLMTGTGVARVHMDYAQFAIAKAQARAGDAVGAQRTGDHIQDPNLEKAVPDAIAQVQTEARLKAGDYLGAQNAAALIHDAWSKNHEQEKIKEAIAKAQATSSSTAEDNAHDLRMMVDYWIEDLNDDNQDHDCALNVDLILDLGGSLKSLPASDDPNKMLNPFLSMVRKIANTQLCVDRWLKKQAKR